MSGLPIEEVVKVDLTWERNGMDFGLVAGSTRLVVSGKSKTQEEVVDYSYDTVVKFGSDTGNPSFVFYLGSQVVFDARWISIYDDHLRVSMPAWLILLGIVLVPVVMLSLLAPTLMRIILSRSIPDQKSCPT